MYNTIEEWNNAVRTAMEEGNDELVQQLVEQTSAWLLKEHADLFTDNGNTDGFRVVKSE